MTTGQPDTPSGQLIPGVRYRTETHKRHVPHTIDGETRIVTEDYEVSVPVAPRDWDRIVLAAVTVLAALLIAVSVAWSTASIGDLLSRAVLPQIAYLGAATFDLVWIACLALEWLARYDTEKAASPRRAGQAALVVAMAAVGAHGWLVDSWVVGLVGAAISALAKTMWTRVIGYHARPLDARTRAWLAQRDSEIGARLALAARLRQQTRAEGQHAALLAATAPPFSGPDSDSPDADPDRPDPSGRAYGTVRSAVHAAAEVLPNPTPAAVVSHLAAVGLDVNEDTVSALLNTQEQPRLRPVGGSVKDSVRTAVASGITEPDAVRDYVRQIHGDGVRPDTVDRYLRTERDSA